MVPRVADHVHSCIKVRRDQEKEKHPSKPRFSTPKFSISLSLSLSAANVEAVKASSWRRIRCTLTPSFSLFIASVDQTVSSPLSLSHSQIHQKYRQRSSAEISKQTKKSGDLMVIFHSVCRISITTTLLF
jgi:hypothetical protein